MRNSSLAGRTRFLYFLLLLALSGIPGAAGETLTVGVLKNFPPQYSLSEEGTPQGFAVDIISELAHMTQQDIRFRIYDNWAQIFEALKSGEIDIIPNIGITERRKEFFSFSNPVETFPVTIFTRSSGDALKDLESLNNKKVAVIRLNIGETLVKDLPPENVVTFDHVEGGVFNLLSGNVDALIYPEPALLLIARQINIDDQIRSEGAPLVEILRGISVRKGNESLLEILNPAIETLLSSDRYGEIYARWYGRTKPFWTPRRVFIAMSTILLLAVLLLLVWKYISTERLVKKRTAQLSFQGQLMSQVRDGVIPIDREGHILGWNRGAERLFLYKEQDMKGRSLYQLLEETQASILEKAIQDHGRLDQAGASMDLKLRRQNGEVFDGILSLSNMVDEKKVLSGYVCLINDITERKALENKKEILITELQEALEQVKTLRGLLPICASCKKIRDDGGYWNNLESYITENSGASFSHSICPDCAKKLYGFEKKTKEDDTGIAQ